MRTGIVSLMLFILLDSCNFLSKDENLTFIPGTYVRHYKDEYTDSYDTIFIKEKEGGSYLVRKMSNYKKINNDNRWEPGTEIKNWMGTYDNNRRVLIIPAYGKQLFFDPATGELRLGTEPYKKLDR